MSDRTFQQKLKDELSSMIAEADKLRKRLQILDRKIEAARVLIDDDAQTVERAATEVVGSAKAPTFAKQVRLALSNIDAVASPTQVAARFKSLGFQQNGKADLVTVVNTELYRMSKSKSGRLGVKRKGTGKYVIQKSERPVLARG